MFSTANVANFGPGSSEDPNDISVLYFDENVVKRMGAVGDERVVKIGSSISRGDTLRLVGFGCDNLVTHDGAGVNVPGRCGLPAR